MSGRILASVRLAVVSAAQRLPSLSTFRAMNARILERSRTSASYAMQDLLTVLISDTTSVLTLAKNLLSVIYAAVGLVGMALATNIKSDVGARGSRFMKNAWSVICRLKALNFDVRS